MSLSLIANRGHQYSPLSSNWDSSWNTRRQRLRSLSSTPLKSLLRTDPEDLPSLSKEDSVMRVFIGSAVLGLACAIASAQPIPESNLVFEVASVKPHVPGAPGTTGRTGIQENAAQIVIENLSLRTLVA